MTAAEATERGCCCCCCCCTGGGGGEGCGSLKGVSGLVESTSGVDGLAFRGGGCSGGAWGGRPLVGMEKTLLLCRGELRLWWKRSVPDRTAAELFSLGSFFL